jgi:hypothetical protein
MSKQFGVTSGGIQEECRWDVLKEKRPCPRHAIHSNVKSKTSKATIEINETENDSDSVSLEAYNSIQENLYSTVDDLTDQWRLNLSRSGFIEMEDGAYRLNADAVTLDKFRLINNMEDFTEEEYDKLQDELFIMIDGVGYTIDEYSELSIIMPDPQGGEYINFKNMTLENGFTVDDYINNHSGKGEVLDYELESLFMNGGCAVYAMGMKELHPEYEIAVDLWDCDGEEMYNHVFCVDTKTGRAFDSRGSFANAEALMDYKSDEKFDGVAHKEGEYYTDEGYTFWTKDKTEMMIRSGVFNYDDSPEDLEYVKKLITGFTTRFTE